MNRLYTHVAAGAGVVFSEFVADSICTMLPWLMAITGLILADLFASVSRIIKWKQELRVSKGVRESLAKFVTYYSVVVCLAMIEKAAATPGLTTSICWIIIIIEGVSILGNIFRYHGYDIDPAGLISLIFSKRLGLSKGDLEQVITKKRLPQHEKSDN